MTNENKERAERYQSRELQADLDALWDLGQKTALARHHHDESLAKFHTDYMRRFIAARPEEFKARLRAQFDQAYKAEAEIHMAFARRHARY